MKTHWFVPKRELSEETGYSAEKYTLLHKLATTVGFSNEWIYII